MNTNTHHLCALALMTALGMTGCGETAEAADAVSEDTPPPAPPPGRFAAEVIAITESIDAAAHGNLAAATPEWNDGFGDRTLAHTDTAAVNGLLSQLGPDPQRAFTTVTFNAYDATWTHRVRGVATVFPDGRVRWGGFSAEDVGDPQMRRLIEMLGDTPANGDPASQRLISGFTELLAQMRWQCDEIEPLQIADVGAMPPRARIRLAPPEVLVNRHAACAHASEHGLGAAMTHVAVGGISVYMTGNDRIIRLRSSLWPQGNQIWLGPVSADDFDQEEF